MPFVAAKCTQCGAHLKVDTANEAAVCQFCNTPFITEKAINNYNNSYNIDTLHADVVNISNDFSREDLIKAGDTFIKLGDFNEAHVTFREATQKYPYDYRGWWGLVKAKSRNFTRMKLTKNDTSEISLYYNKAKMVANEEQITSIATKYDQYIEVVNNTTESRKKQLTDELEHIENEIPLINKEYQNKKEPLESQIAKHSSKLHGPYDFSIFHLIAYIPIALVCFILFTEFSYMEEAYSFFVALLLWAFLIAVAVGVKVILKRIIVFFESIANDYHIAKLTALEDTLQKETEDYNSLIKGLNDKKTAIEAELSKL